MNKYFAIIVAGGKGNRMQSEIPKQFLLLDGRPILMHTIEKFASISGLKLILVLPLAQIDYWKNLCEKYDFETPHFIVNGGETRFHSVQNGLNFIKEEKGIVAIHDGVRPFVSVELIDKLLLKAAKNTNAIPFTFPKESIRKVEKATNKAVNRSDYRFIQTPQCFDLKLLKEAYETPFQAFFTDDASVFEYSNHPINLVEGEYANIKITTPEDLH